jgi:hypothetical protein
MFRIAALAALAVAAPASAVVTMGSITGGSPGMTFSIIAPPPVMQDLWSNPAAVVAFDEGVHTVTADITPGLGSFVAAGTRVESHFVALRVPENSGNRQAIGTVTVGRPIIAVITNSGQLIATNYLGAAGTTYISNDGWGLEFPDVNASSTRLGTTISGNTVTFDWITNKGGPDSIRILTLVPEPATWAMLIAGFGLVGFAARRRRTAVAAA